jgi:sugar phosphate isomerase/epimerase
MANRKYAFLAGLGFGGMEIEQVADILAELGYDGIELTLGHFNPQAMSPEELSKVAATVRAAGLEISEIVVQQDLVRRDPVQLESTCALIADCIRAAADNGVPALNLFTGPPPWDPAAPQLGRDISHGEAWELVTKAFKQMLPVAEDKKVYLAVEAVWGMLARDYYTLQELFRQVDSPYLAVNMDPSHFALYRNDVPWSVGQLGDKIVHVHLKDAIGLDTRQPDDFIFPLLGEGMIDWPAFFGALDDIGYAGYCSVEFESFTYYRTVLQEDVKAAAALSMEQIKALTRQES